MIELACPRPADPRQIRRRFAHAGDIVEMNGTVWPFISPEIDVAFDNLRAMLHRRIDGAFECHRRHHMNDIARRFEYLDRPELRIYEEEMRRIINGLSLARMRGELPEVSRP